MRTHKAHCATTDWPLAGACDCDAARDNLATALEAIGGMPDGFCACFGGVRDPQKPEHEHTGECREARVALASVWKIESEK